MNVIARLALGTAAAGGLLAAAGAQPSPAALSNVAGGLWEVSRAGKPAVQLCVATPVSLAQFEHGQKACEQRIVRDSGTAATVHYTCEGDGFGHSSITVVTDRSLRIETQGISSNAPFKYVLQARRVGDCAGH